MATNTGPGSGTARGYGTTPTNIRHSSGPGKRRRICGAEVANQIAVTPSPPYTRNNSAPSSARYSVYQPSQSLYDGLFEHDLSEDDLGQENYPQNDSIGLHSGPELVKMIQEQQHLLHQVLETQKQMQLKQKDFDDKLEELKKTSESSSSSPNCSETRKFKISRKLSVFTIAS